MKALEKVQGNKDRKILSQHRKERRSTIKSKIKSIEKYKKNNFKKRIEEKVKEKGECNSNKMM